MALKTSVIINEVINLSDARYCAGMGVDYIGFRIDENHDKYVDLENFNESQIGVRELTLLESPL